MGAGRWCVGMAIFITHRLAQSLLVMLAMSVLVFAGVFAIADPVEMLVAPDASAAERLRVSQSLGLDLPLWKQYGLFLYRALHGDLGNSFVHHQSALTLILERAPATLELAFAAMVIALGVGIPLGMLAGIKPGTAYDKLIMAGSILGFSLPTFWVGLLLIMTFAVSLGWLPTTGRGATGTVFGIKTSLATIDGLQHLILPAFNLALFKMALIIRLVRASVRETLLSDYIRFARAKGLRRSRIVWVHVFKSVLIPLITVIGLELGSVIAFAIVTESIFAWPGLGKLIIDSIGLLDRPVIVAYLLITVSMFVTINLIVDILYSLVDPRIRLSDTAG